MIWTTWRRATWAIWRTWEIDISSRSQDSTIVSVRESSPRTRARLGLMRRLQAWPSVRTRSRRRTRCWAQSRIICTSRYITPWWTLRAAAHDLSALRGLARYNKLYLYDEELCFAT